MKRSPMRFKLRPLCSLLLMSAAFAAHAQPAYPSKPIRLVASTLPGSQPDSLARLFGQEMSKRWGFPVIIDNRPGAAGVLAASVVAKAAPDGHTLLYALPNFIISTALQPNLPYDPLRDFTGSTQIGFSTNLLVATPALGVKSIKEFIALARSQPGKLIFASSSPGSASYLSGVKFNLAAGIKAIHVAFKGGPDAAIEVLAGRSHYNVATLGVALPFIKEGKLQALALTSPQRTPALPEVPTLAEFLVEFKVPETSHGIVAPAGTPRSIVLQINREIARILEIPDIRERILGIGFVIAPSTPEEYNKILRVQLESTLRLVKEAGLRPK